MAQRQHILNPFRFVAKMRGGALLVSVIVCLCIGVILLLFMLLGSHNQRYVGTFQQQLQLQYHLQSALALAQSGQFANQLNGKWMKVTFGKDSIKLNRQAWGAYVLMRVWAKNNHTTTCDAGLYGTYLPADTGLMVADNSRPVGASGKIEFKAPCYLPVAGIRPAYIEGQSYQGLNLAPFVRKAPAEIPNLSEIFVNGIEAQLQGGHDSLVAELPPVFSNPFTARTVTWETSSPLKNRYLKNNLRITGNYLVVDSSCHLDNVLLVCRSVRFGKGFKGRVHVVASDSIVTSDECVFDFPSSLVLLVSRGTGNGLASVVFGADNRFSGSVVATVADVPQGQKNVLVKLNGSSQLNGLVYSSGYLHVEGELNATLLANKLLLKTASAVYENHLLACSINPGKYAGVLAVPLLFNQRGALRRCQKVN